MLERLLITLFLLAAGGCASHLFLRAQLQRTSALVQVDPLLRDLKRGIPAIIYFTTPTCAPCRTIQSPALARLQNDYGDGIQIVRIDATEYPEDAARWGVFSAPTTFIIDSSGRTRAVNHGAADDQKLKRQIEETASI